MILFIGFIAAGPREAIQASSEWIDRLSVYEGDPVVRAANASTVAKYGASVTEMLAGGRQKARSPIQIYHFQYAFYTMLARAVLLKRADISGILGYSGGIQPGLLAAGIFTASNFPAEVTELNLEVAEQALHNREQGISACCIDFSESDWKVEEVFELIRKKFDGNIYLQDRRNVGVMDFVGPRALMVDFLATLDKRGGMAVRASRLRLDGGYHTPLMGSYLEKPHDLDCWAEAPTRLSASPLMIGSTVGHWWPRTSGARDVRDLTLRSQTDPIESGRLATLVKDRGLIFLGSRIVLLEVFAGTGYVPPESSVLRPEML
jgi:hypothetical protein